VKGPGRISFIIIILLGIIGIILSYILAQDFYFGEIYKKTGDKLSVFTELSSSVCGEGSSFINCAKVSRSKYAKIMDIPNAIWGMIFFSVISFLALTGQFLTERVRALTSYILFWLLLLGSLFDIALLLISVFLLDAICSLCFATYIVNWISLLLIILYYRKSEVNPLRAGRITGELFSHHRSIFLKKYLPGAILIVILSSVAGFSLNADLKSTWKGFVDKARKEAIEKILGDFPRQKIVDVNPSEVLVIGDPDAPVTIVEFSDFLCPFCSQASALLEKLVEENRGKVRLIFMNYPLDNTCNVNMKKQLHPGACILALGSISAAKQGMFREYHDAAFRLKPKNPGKREIEQIAALSGLNRELFFKDLASPEVKNELLDQLQRGWDLGVNGTPAIYINGRLYRYRPVKEILQEIIDREYEASLAGKGE
jgi:protein-disulfide isomerase/uncharacterized membrane protein